MQEPAISIDTTLVRNIAKEVCRQFQIAPSNWFDWVSFIASIATLICFAITLYQMLKVEKSGKQIKRAVEENSNRIQNGLTMITITDALRMSDMVIMLTHNNSYEQAAIRLHDLNNAAIEICQFYSQLKTCQLKLPSEIEHLYDMAKNKNSVYSADYVLSTLQQFNDSLKEIESSVKMKIIDRESIKTK